MNRLSFRLKSVVWRLVFVFAIAALVLSGPWLMSDSAPTSRGPAGLAVEIR